MTTALMEFLYYRGFEPYALGGGCTGLALELTGSNRLIVVTDQKGFACPDNQASGWLVRIFDSTATDYDAALLESMDSDSYPYSGPCLAIEKAIARHEVQGRTLAEKLRGQAVAKLCDNGANPRALALAFVEGLKGYLTPDQWQEMRRRNTLPDYRDTGACASHDFCDANQFMSDAFARFGIDSIGDSDAPAGSPEDVRREAVAVLWNRAWDIAKREALAG